MGQLPSAFSLHDWIDEHRDLLKPPVGNCMVWKDSGIMVMVVGGPNQRKDFHINPTEEFFYQLEGDIALRVRENGEARDIPIKQGQVFMLPANVPHSPQRPANTVGLVIERERPSGQHDHIRWYCDDCGEILYDPSFQMEDLGSQIKPVIEEFKSNSELRTCGKCGHVTEM